MSLLTNVLLLVLTYVIYRVFLKPADPRVSQIPRAPITFSSIIEIFTGRKLSMEEEYHEWKKDILFPSKPTLTRGLIKTYSVFIAEPEAAKTLLMYTSKFPKFMPWQSSDSFMNRLFGINVGMTNGDEWKRHRRLMNPSFKKSWDTNLFGEIAVHVVQKWIKEPGLEVHKMMQALTLDAIGKAAFNFDFKSVENPDSELVQVYSRILDALVRFPIRMMLPRWFPLPSLRQLERDLDKLDETLYGIIQKRKDEFDNGRIIGPDADVLDSMLQGTRKSEDGEEPATLTLKELRDDVWVLFLAGNDTTANTLSCVLYHLAKYPEWQDRVRQEVLQNLPLDDISEFPRKKYPTFDQQVEGFPIMTAVIKECLRLFPPAAAINPRIASEDVTFPSGVEIPKGTLVNLDIFSLGRNPDYWDEPDKFDPERFLDDRVKSMHPFQWIPFGGGQRLCLGMGFSYVEQRTTLSVLLRNLKFSLPEDSIHQSGYKMLPGELVTPRQLVLNVTKWNP